jgi:hypothetical protein
MATPKTIIILIPRYMISLMQIKGQHDCPKWVNSRPDGPEMQLQV